MAAAGLAADDAIKKVDHQEAAGTIEPATPSVPASIAYDPLAPYWNASIAAPAEPWYARRNWILTGGVDYTPAYYRRGYLQDNSGLLIQPFVTGAYNVAPDEEGITQPYLTSWNSLGLLDLQNPMAVMVEGMAGVFLKRGPYALDINYAIYNSSPMDGRSTIHEFGGKFWLDLTGLWEETGQSAPFRLRSFVGLIWETYDEKGSLDGYWEFGIEPAWRQTWRQQLLTVSLPLQLGMSGRNYYFNANGREQSLGYASVGLSASISLPSPSWGGRWYLSSSIYYTRLAADNLIAINNGAPNVFTGRIGLGFAY